ncbi:ArsC/Spx/MgsR family protein [Herminiimonas arsenitoxidans]|uniref:ArsC/Spx/MgsR family protein n=1 Tax=Herminiimonas arsenitoxidans TaxID=1809410 RepID=UPI000970D90A|nr:ArsC/Spx/MgsR family protein [Herminiimonas arsenitoxidans]
MLIIYHNPRCSKSRGALELAQQFATQHGLTLDVVDYQKTPLTQAQLTELHHILQSEQAVSVRDMVRDNEDEFTSLKLAHADDASLLRALAAHPKLLQRPIVRFHQRAVIARPPELANAILVAS